MNPPSSNVWRSRIRNGLPAVREDYQEWRQVLHGSPCRVSRIDFHLSPSPLSERDRDMSRGTKRAAQETKWRRIQQYDIGLLLSPPHLHTPRPISVLGWLPVRASAHSARASFTLVSHPSSASRHSHLQTPSFLVGCGRRSQLCLRRERFLLAYPPTPRQNEDLLPFYFCLLLLPAILHW
jgi:hypothetical protein